MRANFIENYGRRITFELIPPVMPLKLNKQTEYELTVKQAYKKRSLDANAYFWVLVTKIGEKTHLSSQEVHDRILAENIHFVLKDEAVDWLVMDCEPNKYGLVKCGDDYYLDSKREVMLAKDDGSFYKANGKPKTSKILWHIKGTHQMNSKEMSHIIDATINEAKDLGIETMPEDEIKRMVEGWNERTMESG